MLSLQETGNLSPDCLNHWTIREIPNKWLLTVWFFSEWDTGRRWKEVLAEMSATAGNIPVARASNNRVAVGGAKNSAGSGHLLAGSMQVRASHTTQVLTEHQSERVLGMCVCALGVHLGCVCVCVYACLTLCNFMGCSPPGSSVHGMSPARILEWVATSSSRGPSQPRIEALSLVSPALTGGFFTSGTTCEATHLQQPRKKYIWIKMIEESIKKIKFQAFA